MRANTEAQFIAQLATWGMTDIEAADGVIYYTDDYYSKHIEGPFEDIKTLADLNNECVEYSCCGDELDPDHMICETCKEHC